MSIFEYNEEEEMRKLREGEHQIGKEEGKAEGKAEGKVEGKAESVLEVLELYGQVPEYAEKRILEEDDIKLLSVWLKEAAKAGSVEGFLEKTGLKEDQNG